MELFISSLWFAVTIWLITRAAGQRGLLPHLAPATPPPPAQALRVVVIVPARDEEANLGTCLQAPAAVVLAWAAVAVPVIDAALWVQSWGQLWGHGANVAGPDLALLSALILAVPTSAAAFALHVAATFYFRIPFWYGLLFPLGHTLGALIAFDSVRRRWRGRVSWKGRIYS